MAPMRARLISVGTELVLGQTVDTNSAWLAQRLAERGIETASHETVSDDTEPIRDAITRAAGDADCVIVTGGLGPTDDDLTRHALAAAMNVELIEDPPALSQIQAFFARRRIPMPDANRRQALGPRGARLIENLRGTAPGLAATIGRATVFALPGVPGEMKAMFERDVAPALRVHAGEAVILQTVIRTCGAPESQIGQQIADLMVRGRNPNVGTTAADLIIGVRINARGRTPDEARELMRRDADEVRRRLGHVVFGEGDATLQEAVAVLLWSSGRTVATAESCTGGLIARRLTDVSGSSRYFKAGFVTYANDMKTSLLGVPADLLAARGAVSREVAEAMAVGARTRAAADYCLSATGIAGPTGGSPDKPIGLVFLGLSSAAGCVVKDIRLGDHLGRAEIRDRAAKLALNMLRLALLGRDGSRP